MTADRETETPKAAPAEGADTPADRKRREIERGVFERRRPPETPAPHNGGRAAGACGHADDTEAHPS